MQNYTPSVTEEMYISKNWAESNGMSYAEFIENEQYDWSMNRDAGYYVSESEVHP